MSWNKIFVARTAFIFILFTALFLLPQSDLPFVGAYFSCCAELYPLLKGVFSLVLLYAGWKLAAFGKDFVTRQIFFWIFFICSVLLLYGTFLFKWDPAGFSFSWITLWAGYLLGLLEREFEFLAIRLFWGIIPLPFLLHFIIPFRKEYFICAAIFSGGSLLFIHGLLILKNQPVLKKSIFFVGICIAIFLAPCLYFRVQTVKTSSPASQRDIENQIKVVIEIVKQFQNYSFTNSERNNLYQSVFYRFASHNSFA